MTLRPVLQILYVLRTPPPLSTDLMIGPRESFTRDNLGSLIEDGRVIQVTEPQVWVLIGVFAAAMFGMIGIVNGNFVRVLRSEIGGVRSEIGGVRSEIGGVRSEISRLDAKIDALDAKLSARLDYLDRDVQLLMKREFGEPT